MNTESGLYTPLSVDKAFEKSMRTIKAMGGMGTRTRGTEHLTSSVEAGFKTCTIDITIEPAGEGSRINISASSFEVVSYAAGSAIERFTEIFREIDKAGYIPPGQVESGTVLAMVGGMVFLIPIVIFLLYYFHQL